MRAVYAPGAGLLLGSGLRWVLLDQRPDLATVDRLWRLVSEGPAASPAGQPLGPAVLDAVSALRDTISLAVVDATSGDESTLVHGRGAVGERDGVRLLTVGLSADDGSLELELELALPLPLPLVAGAVAAASVSLTEAPTPSPVPRRTPLIDGIPDEVLRGRSTREPRTAPESPDRTRQRAALPPTAPDRDGLTMRRVGSAGRPQPEPLGHLQQGTHETVLSAVCPAGHHTPGYAPTCRVCAAPVAPQDPVRVPRPVLGVLRLPDGEAVPLDRGVVLGRKPEPVPGAGPWPHLVQLPGDSTYLSRVHLQVELDGWLVLARDLGSRAGTTLRVPGRPPQRIRAHEAYVLEPGHVLDLADDYAVTYELTEAPAR